MHTLFTVVIPVYNAEKYIADMIESVKRQSYTDWNLIIIDDGSNDDTGAICDKYADDKIQVFHYENQGQMVARITGIMKATGEYTLVVDADDYLEKDCLKKIYDVLKYKKYDMVTFPIVCCDETLCARNELSGKLETDMEIEQEELLRWIIKTYNHGLVNKATRTDLIQKGALEATKKKLKINGDYALIVPIICQIKNVYYLNEPLYLYRIYGLSISHNSSFQQIVDTDYVSIEVLKLLKKHNLASKENVDSVYYAYLHMIIWMMEKLVYEGKYKKDDIISLSKMECFTKSGTCELIKELPMGERLELWLLRRKSGLFKEVVRIVLFQRIFRTKLKKKKP